MRQSTSTEPHVFHESMQAVQTNSSHLSFRTYTGKIYLIIDFKKLSFRWMISFSPGFSRMELVSLRKMYRGFRKKKIAKLKTWRLSERNAYQEQAQYDIHANCYLIVTYL
jgi:hypothetical protein